jgi:hypothetical protein
MMVLLRLYLSGRYSHAHLSNLSFVTDPTSIRSLPRTETLRFDLLHTIPIILILINPFTCIQTSRDIREIKCSETDDYKST